jgi:hypothetical protein
MWGENVLGGARLIRVAAGTALLSTTYDAVVDFYCISVHLKVKQDFFFFSFFFPFFFFIFILYP